MLKEFKNPETSADAGKHSQNQLLTSHSAY